jgi:hypothetical protein
MQIQTNIKSGAGFGPSGYPLYLPGQSRAGQGGGDLEGRQRLAVAQQVSLGDR